MDEYVRVVDGLKKYVTQLDKEVYRFNKTVADLEECIIFCQQQEKELNKEKGAAEYKKYWADNFPDLRKREYGMKKQECWQDIKYGTIEGFLALFLSIIVVGAASSAVDISWIDSLVNTYLLPVVGAYMTGVMGRAAWKIVKFNKDMKPLAEEAKEIREKVGAIDLKIKANEIAISNNRSRIENLTELVGEVRWQLNQSLEEKWEALRLIEIVGKNREAIINKKVAPIIDKESKEDESLQRGLKLIAGGIETKSYVLIPPKK